MIFQVWLNLPKVDKFVEPHFKMLWKETIPVIKETNANGKSVTVDLIAGDLAEKKAAEPTPSAWAAKADNFVRVLTVKLEEKTKWTLPATDVSANRNIYFYAGEKLTVDKLLLEKDHQVTLKSDADIIIENNSQEAAYLLVLEGKPIGEPVAQHGPFVMNTFEEIQQAIADYQRTQFGGWPWKEREKTHDADKDRFALHADGTEDIISTE